MNYMDYYSKRKLLSKGDTNAKLAKNTMKTYGLSLLPHRLNSAGKILCPFSTKECREMCLNSSGRSAFNSVQKARLNKTDYFVHHKKDFIKQLHGELHSINSRKEKSLVRLNVVSDVNWEYEFELEGYDIGKFDNIQFYGYTKNPFHITMNKAKNQHFTFSYSGGNWKWCEKFLNEKTANVAVVFKGEPPSEYRGYKVINGDESDQRVDDEKGVIVGLKYKIPRGVEYKSNKFVVEDY